MENLEKELTNESSQNNVNDSTDYINALKEMKQKSVSRDSYDKLKQENRQLLDALVEGRTIDVQPVEKPDINKLREELYGRGCDKLTNLDYVDKTLKLRRALIESGERDPFLPAGSHVKLTSQHFDQANATADALQHCVDFADGDSSIFTAELQRITREAIPSYMQRGRK